jgi:hypothetical protein
MRWCATTNPFRKGTALPTGWPSWITPRADLLARLYDGVSLSRLSEPLGAELRPAFQSVEVDVDKPEPVPIAVDPFEVVLAAPEEVPVDGTPLDVAC